MTQLDALRKHFDAGGTLTVAEALTAFGIYALSQRCGELRGEGYPLASRMIETASGKRVAEYYKIDEECDGCGLLIADCDCADESEDRRLDDPRHGQAEYINRMR